MRSALTLPSARLAARAHPRGARPALGYGRAMRAWIVTGIVLSSAIARAGGALKGDVLVWDDATFYAEPSDDAATMKLARLDHSSKEAIVGHVIAMHVVGRHGEYVEVEPVADGQCTGTALEAYMIGHLRIFVKEDALAAVVVKRWTARFDDGSRVTLGVGEPVVSVGDDGVAFAVDGVVLHASVLAASIGTSYPAITPSAPPSDARFDLRAGAQGTIAGQTYIAHGTHVVQLARAIDHPRKGQSRFPIQLRCGEIDAVFPDEAVEAYEPLADALVGDGIGVGRVMDDDRYLLPKGTLLSTPAGRHAGVADEDIDVKRPAAGDTKACFDADLSLTHDFTAPTEGEESITGATITLCAPAANVKHEHVEGLGHGFGTLGHHH